MSPVKTELIEKDLIFVHFDLARRAAFDQTMPTSLSEKFSAII